MPCDRRALRTTLQRKRERSGPPPEREDAECRPVPPKNSISISTTASTSISSESGNAAVLLPEDILTLPLLEACRVLSGRPELIFDPRFGPVKALLSSLTLPPAAKLSSGPGLLNIELRLLPRIVRLVQYRAADLAACSAVCRDLHAVSKPMLATQREHVWHSSNINLPLLSVRRGQANCWVKHSNAARLECYEAARDTPHVKLRDCAVFRAGDHPEPFNQLHGYYSLSNARMPGRYQGGLFYPYIGMSREGAANCAPELCLHPPDDYGLCIVLAFLCPESGFYILSEVSARLFDERGDGPVVMGVYAIRKRSGEGTVPEQLEPIFRHQVEGVLAHSPATPPVSVQLRQGDRIAFSLSIGREGPPLEGGFRFGVTRVTWNLRHGQLDDERD